jgi:prepilin-type processing-associated H-X9-DG protein
VRIEFRQTTTRDGITMHYLAVPFVTPAWAVKDGNLFLALYPQVVDAAISQTPASASDSILQNPAFIAVQKRLGDHKPAGIEFTNLPAVAGDGYSTMLALSRLYLGFADMFGVQTPAMVLPPLNKLLPHVAPVGGVSWSDASGWHFKSIQPFPGSQLLAGGGMGTAIVGQSALMTSILLPSLNRARETANRVKCASNERMIGQAMLLYANENKQKYPDDLGTLVKTQDISVDAFVCPTADNSIPAEILNGTLDQKAAWVNEHADYVYLGKGQTTSSPADRIMVYEKPGAHEGDGMNILYGDGHVEFQVMREATRQIDKQEHRGEQGL